MALIILVHFVCWVSAMILTMIGVNSCFFQLYINAVDLGDNAAWLEVRVKKDG